MPNRLPSPADPQFSIIIAVYNDWGPLEKCLESLDEQIGGSDFEVVVVDDGSTQAAQVPLDTRACRYPLILVRQEHAGIAAARNKGIQNSRGSVLVFTDADCRPQPNCLRNLEAAIIYLPRDKYFQLFLTGDHSSIVGQAEELRLKAIQTQMLQADGRIRYLNTAGFAVRREGVDASGRLFNPVALRSEDTLLLVDLIQRNELPLFVADAVIQHRISMSLVECLKKDVRAAWLEAKTFAIIAARGVQIRMGHIERIGMLVSTWRTAKQNSITRKAWLVLVIRQSLQRVVTLSYEGLWRLGVMRTGETRRQ